MEILDRSLCYSEIIRISMAEKRIIWLPYPPERMWTNPEEYVDQSQEYVDCFREYVDKLGKG